MAKPIWKVRQREVVRWEVKGPLKRMYDLQRALLEVDTTVPEIAWTPRRFDMTFYVLARNNSKVVKIVELFKKKSKKVK